MLYIDMNYPWVYMWAPSWTLLLPPSPSCPSRLSQCTGFECPASCIELGLVIYFTYGNIRVSMLFSQIIPPSPSPTESKSLFFKSLSLVLSCIWDHHYHLSKFHIYVLIYCIGVFLSDPSFVTTIFISASTCWLLVKILRLATVNLISSLMKMIIYLTFAVPLFASNLYTWLYVTWYLNDLTFHLSPIYNNLKIKNSKEEKGGGNISVRQNHLFNASSHRA